MRIVVGSLFIVFLLWSGNVLAVGSWNFKLGSVGESTEIQLARTRAMNDATNSKNFHEMVCLAGQGAFSFKLEPVRQCIGDEQPGPAGTVWSCHVNLDVECKVE